MKGVIFVELIEMAESIAGEEQVDEIIDTCDLSSGGAFTSVGNYPCSDLMQLVEAFGKALDAPVDKLQSDFGGWMFKKFVQSYPSFFRGKEDAFTMLESIENEVHVEVRKLYPEVELPSFDTERVSENELKMIYTSERPLVAFCEGMIKACVEHFGRTASISHVDRKQEDKFYADFNIKLAD